MKLSFGDRAVAEETGRHAITILQLVGQGQADGDRQPAADNRVAAVKPPRRVEQMHRAAAPAATPVHLAEHFGHHRAHRNAARQRVAMLAIGCDDRVLWRKRSHRAGRHRLFADVKVQKTVNLTEAVQLGAFLLEAADAQHLAQERQRMVTLDFRLFRFSGRSHYRYSSTVDVSPTGNPSSCALSNRRMIFPLRVRGSLSLNSISFGATTAPSLVRANASNSRRSSSTG